MRCLIMFDKILNTVKNELTPYFKDHSGLKPLNWQTIIGLLDMDDENILSKYILSMFYYFLKGSFIIPDVLIPSYL